METLAYTHKQIPAKEQTPVNWPERLLIIGIFTYLLIALFPALPSPLPQSIDGQFFWALNCLSHAGYQFGKDVVSTYGPLAFCLEPINLARSLYMATGLQLLLYLLFMSLAFSLALKQQSAWQSGLFAIMLLAQASFDGYVECKIELLICLLGCSVLAFPRVANILALCLGILASSTCFMKFSLGAAATTSLIISAICWRLKWGLPAYRWIGSLTCGYTFIFFLLAVYLFRSTGDFSLWLKGSLEILCGYTDGMCLSGPIPELVSALSIIIVFLGGLIYLRHRQSDAFFPALLIAPLLLITFKHAFVRQDAGHFLLFVYPTLGLLSFLFLLVTNKKEGTGVACLYLLSLITFANWQLWQPFSISTLKQVIQCTNGIQNIESLGHFRQVMSRIDSENQRFINQFRLSPKVTNLIGQRKCVGAIPLNLLYCPANHLKWSPNLTLQLYLAFTPYLESRSAAHFTGASAPDFVLADFDDIDDRNTLMTNPETWRAILANYRALPVEDSRLVLLSKTSKPSVFTTTRLIQSSGIVGKWIEVPNCSELLYANVGFSPKLLGNIAGAFYQTAPVNIELQFESGKYALYRIIPKLMNSGLLLNYLPTSIKELQDLFQHRCQDRVLRFRILTTQRTFWRTTFPIVWWTQQFPIQYEPISKLCASSQKSTQETSFSIDSLCGKPLLENPQVVLKSGDRLSISGWAVDLVNRCAAAAVALEVDGSRCIYANYGAARPDVADHLSLPKCTNSGFIAEIDSKDLTPGRHIIRLKIISKDYKHYYQPQLQIIATRQ